MAPKAPRERINEQIRALEVRVIDESGAQLGVMTPSEAMLIAREREMDLVEVAPLAKPPVCRVMDYGKFQYQQTKSEKNNKAKQKKVDTKGVRLGIRTDTHDLEIKKLQTEKFLDKGHKVKIEIRLRGREKAHMDLARANLQEFINSITQAYQVEEGIKRFPGGLNIILAPKEVK